VSIITPTKDIGGLTMPISSDNILLEAALKRELQHIELLINGIIETDLSYDNLSTIKNYMQRRLKTLSE
jgi:hypothetical protein